MELKGLVHLVNAFCKCNRNDELVDSSLPCLTFAHTLEIPPLEIVKPCYQQEDKSRELFASTSNYLVITTVYPLAALSVFTLSKSSRRSDRLVTTPSYKHENRYLVKGLVNLTFKSLCSYDRKKDLGPLPKSLYA